MLSLEKLFYQHQYQPLELSTYLSDYIADVKSPVKQEECTKRLYQLFLRFFNKFSTFQDSSLLHLVLSISFSVLTHLCENSSSSFSNFFQFGLAAHLVEQVRIEVLRDNENTLSKFLSMVHLFCDSHTQNELEPLCHFIVPLLDTILLQNIKIKTKTLTSSLVNKLTDHISPSTVIQLKSGKTFSTLIVSIGKSIGSLGDIFLQSDVIESIFRLTSKTERIRLADILFTSPAIAKAFREISEQSFEKESRNFLNTLNTSLGSQQRVFSYPCTEAAIDGTVIKRPADLDFLWADFNSASHNLTMFISHPFNGSAPEWLTAYFRRDSFTKLSLSSTNQGYQLQGTLSVSKHEVSEVFPVTTAPLSLQLSFSSEHNPTQGMTCALGYTGNTIVNLPVTNDSCDKPPLFRASMSMQAIRLTKHATGHLNTSITNTIQSKPCTPVPENIENVSPIKVSSQDTQVPPPLTQQTTPVAPIPPVDPLTSTPLQTASFTPNFTPNNIRIVKDQSENVLALSGSFQQQQQQQMHKNAVQGKCDKPLNPIAQSSLRNHTPSSLVTHVTTPVDDRNGNPREKRSRIETVSNEIVKGEEAKLKSDAKQIALTETEGEENSVINENISENNIPESCIQENRVATPRSIRVSNSKKTFHEESHLLKPRDKTRQTYGQCPPKKLRKIAPESNENKTDPVNTKSNPVVITCKDRAIENGNITGIHLDLTEINELLNNTPISILDDTSNLKLSMINKTNSVASPLPLVKGNKRIALSNSITSLNESLSPQMLQNMNKFKRIAPKSISPSVTPNVTIPAKRATRITKQKRGTTQTTSPIAQFYNTRTRKQCTNRFSPENSSDNQSGFSPMLESSCEFPANRTRSRNVAIIYPANKVNVFRSKYCMENESMVTTRYIEKVTTSKSKKQIQQKTRKISKRKPGSPIQDVRCLDSSDLIATTKSFGIQASKPTEIPSFEFKINGTGEPIENYLKNYENNLKNVYFKKLTKPTGAGNSTKVKQVFNQMKELLCSENDAMYSQYRDWYLETRNLIATISEIRPTENELRNSLYTQFQLAVNQVHQNTQKQQVSAFKKRIQSFIIKI